MPSNIKKCSIEGCESPIIARGWCSLHYQRWMHHGDPLLTKTPNMVRGPSEFRFWSKVEKTDTCWIWGGNKNQDGYGLFYPLSKKTAQAHRFSWSLINGPVPDGLYVCHKCDNPSCVNPDHLFVGTQTDNMRDCKNKGRRPIRLLVKCKRGHDLSGDNLYISGVGRQCRACRSIAWQRFKQRRSA